MQSITQDMQRLLFIIHEYTKCSDEDNPVWIKELPLLAIIHQGIVTRLFDDYDYSPSSVPMLDGTRKWLNISREGMDDIEDLTNLRLLSVLRLSTSKFGYVTAYRPTSQAQNEIESIPHDIREQVRRLISHSCGSFYSVIVSHEAVGFHCEQCDCFIPIPMDEIEDVRYTTEPYFPSMKCMEE